MDNIQYQFHYFINQNVGNELPSIKQVLPVLFFNTRKANLIYNFHDFVISLNYEILNTYFDVFD